MKHEAIIKRLDGAKIKIYCRIWASSLSNDNEINYEIDVSYCLPNKRKFIHVDCGDDYSYRKLDKKGRNAYLLNEQLKYVTKEEIYAVKIALWEKLKPIE